MPNESVNLYLSIQSGSSERTLTSLTDKTKAFDKETQLLRQATAGLASANKPLLEQQTKLQSELKASQKTVNELQKVYDEYGDELSKLKLDEAVENHAKLKQELTEVNAQLNANQRTYKEYLETVRKGGLQDGGNQSDGVVSLAKGLATSALGSMVSSALGGYADTLLTSALGSSDASFLSGTLSSAISGAAAGAVAGLPGTIIGGLLGAGSGALTGYTQIYQEKDDAYKEYYNQLIDTYGGLSAGNTAAGSTIASGWEDDLRVFSVLLDDDEEAARRFQNSLIELGRTPPFSYDTVSALSKDMLGLGLSTDEALTRINALADAAAALDWSESSVSSVISYLESAQLAGSLDSRVVKSLSKMGVNVYGALADEFGISEDEVTDQLSDLDVERAVSAIYAYLGEHFAGAAAGLTDTYSGASGVLASYQDEIDAAAGEGYNTLRTQGIQEEIDALGGALGDAMKEINTIIGENQARSENLQEEYMRQAISAVLLGEEGSLLTDRQQAALSEMAAKYAEAAEAYKNGSAESGLEMQSLYEQAQALGQAYYDSSEWAQTEVDVQREQIEAIRENTYGLAAATDAYRLAKEEDKGMASVSSERKRWNFIDILEGTGFGLLDDPDEVDASSHAFGLDRVPYNDYPALLHEGERVLTAGEARAMDRGSSGFVGQITVTGNNFVGTGEEMADQIAEILARKVEQAAVAAAPR